MWSPSESSSKGPTHPSSQGYPAKSNSGWENLLDFMTVSSTGGMKTVNLTGQSTVSRPETVVKRR